MTSANDPMMDPDAAGDRPTAERLERELARVRRWLDELGSWEWDLVTGGVNWSPELYALLGVEEGSSAASYETYAARVHPDDRALVERRIRRALRERSAFEVAHRIVHASGAQRTIVTSGQIVTDAAGEPVRFTGTMQDVTAHLAPEQVAATAPAALEPAAAESLRRSVERSALVARATQEVIWDWDLADGVEWSSGLARLLGYELPGRHSSLEWWSERVHPEDLEGVASSLREALGSGAESWTGEYRFRRADGGYVRLLDRGYIVRGAAGEPVRMIGSMTDITALRRAEGEAVRAAAEKERLFREAEEARRAAEQQERGYRHILDSASDAILIADAELRYVAANAAASELLGYTREELLSLRVADLMTPEELAEVPRHLAELRSGRTLILERTVVRRDGGRVPVEISAKALGDEIQAIVRDISERRRVEAVTHRTFRQLRALAEAAVEIPAAGDVPRILELLAGSTRALIGGDHAHAALMQAPLGLVARAAAGTPVVLRELTAIEHESFTWLLAGLHDPLVVPTRESAPAELQRCLGGTEPPLLLVPVPGRDGANLGMIYAAAGDVAAAGEADLAVLHQLAHIGSVAIQNVRLLETLVATERSYREMFEDDLTADFIAELDGTLRVCNAAYVRTFGFASREHALATNMAQLHRDADQHHQLCARLRRQRVLEMEELVLRTVGGKEVHVLANLVAVHQQDELVAVKGYLLDVTERKALEEQLLQSQKMEAVGQLAGGIAHDFNNLLTTIRGTTHTLLDTVTDDTVRSDVQEIDRAAERAGDLTRQLLAFSRRQVLAPRLLNPNSLIIEMSRMLSRLIGEDVDLRLELSPILDRVEADPGQIEQVLMNLVVNARDAMPQGGRLTIETRNARLDEADVARYGYVIPGPYVMIVVSDTGEGIPEGLHDRIFEPFFTTKEVGKGTGLGLSTVYGIVKQSGGYIWVDSEPGRGASFRVYLPRVDEVARTDDTPAAAPPIATLGRGELLLLVEDDAGVRKLASRVLERSGYRVVTAESGDQAVDITKVLGDRIELVITDVVMPRMSGPELVVRLHQLRPALPVLFMSGYTSDAVVRHGMEHGVDFMQKPFTPAGLTARVGQILSRAN
jgi:two-component system, cell cycle sensor histidine kinase and response regulator CckA